MQSKNYIPQVGENEGEIEGEPEYDELESKVVDNGLPGNIMMKRPIKHRRRDSCRLCGDNLIDRRSWHSIKETSIDYLCELDPSNFEGVLPLTMTKCGNCGLSQCREVIDDTETKGGIPDQKTNIYIPAKERAKWIAANFSSNKRPKLLGFGHKYIDQLCMTFLISKGYKVESADLNLSKDCEGPPGITSYKHYCIDLPQSIKRPFDIVTCSNEFDSTDDIRLYFKDIKSKIALNGILVIDVRDFNKVARKDICGLLRHHHMSYWSPRSIIVAANIFGFRLENIVDVPGDSTNIRYVLTSVNEQTGASTYVERLIAEKYPEPRLYPYNYDNTVSICSKNGKSSKLHSKTCPGGCNYRELPNVNIYSTSPLLNKHPFNSFSTQRLKNTLKRNGFKRGDYIAYGFTPSSVVNCSVLQIWPHKVISDDIDRIGMIAPWYNAKVVDVTEVFNYKKCLILDAPNAEQIKAKLKKIGWRGKIIVSE